MKTQITQFIESYLSHYQNREEIAKLYTEFGSSYTNEDGTGANSIGSEVCGKCITGSPCAFRGF